MLPQRSHKIYTNTLTASFLALFGGLLMLCCICQSSCTPKVDKENPFIGKWDLISASRNGKLTRTLEDGYLHFLNDTVFVTNIFSEEEEFEYNLTQSGFRQLGNDGIDFELLNDAIDTLILGADIRDYDFLFVAVRDTLSQTETVAK